jgi:hypothetical protein
VRQGEERPALSFLFFPEFFAQEVRSVAYLETVTRLVPPEETQQETKETPRLAHLHRESIV